MENAPVVPDGNIIRVLPLEPHLQIVVLVHQLQEPLQQSPALLFRHPVHVLHVAAHGEHALPPRYRVRPHHRMNRFQLAADVFRRAPRLVVQRESGARGDLVETGLGEGGRERLEEFLVRRADAVVDLVAGCPERVCVRNECVVREPKKRGLARLLTSACLGQLD
jgi:hypothetical protein